jgi:hypothetical protein
MKQRREQSERYQALNQIHEQREWMNEQSERTFPFKIKIQEAKLLIY